ncbi:MAG: GYD domain-containing protein [Desulfobaccales bacterium]
MATFLMFGKYSAQALKEMSPGRTQKTRDKVKELGGEVKAIYAMLGKYDLLLVVNLPGIEAAMKASLALSKMTGISFNTAPALPVEEFDKIIGQV